MKNASDDVDTSVYTCFCLLKGTQTSHYDNLTESTTQRNDIGWKPLGRRNPLVETIMAGVTPSEMQQETKAAMSFIKEQVRIRIEAAQGSTHAQGSIS